MACTGACHQKRGDPLLCCSLLALVPRRRALSCGTHLTVLASAPRPATARLPLRAPQSNCAFTINRRAAERRKRTCLVSASAGYASLLAASSRTAYSRHVSVRSQVLKEEEFYIVWSHNQNGHVVVQEAPYNLSNDVRSAFSLFTSDLTLSALRLAI